IDIVRTKRFDLKPMDAEEAVMQMDMLGHSFFVFQNSDTSDVNVVYRRHDGRYGLIEPK
ncbi:MAG TPA: sigma 54 modulation/S30EA ribosomal C-terminal domain-containing protein, partial [Candidatus Bathyarchaeia archaeon]|nr:sigma 54 modulation/S30EA ribosomal C-terminal domain-containing protein [Candidatus Bathyarchaeia archaeon]